MLLLIKNVKLYAPDDMGTNDILICNEKIVNVGKKLQIRYEDLRVLDGEGMFAVPGFIDQHVHVTGGGGEGSFRTRVPELKLSDCVKAGVTTVLGLLGTDGLTRSVENLVAKTKALNEEGITAYCLTGSYGYPPITLTGNLKKDVAFIQEVLGVKVAISDHRSSHMTKEEFTRVASDVRVASLMSGKPGLIVCHLGNGKRGLGPIFDVLDDTELPIWHFRPTHAQKVREDAIAFGKRGGYVDYTAGARGTGTAKSVVGAIEAGIPAHLITVSTDSNGSQPRWNEKNEMVGITAAGMDTLLATLKALVFEAEMPLSKALGFITSNVASALGLESKKGALKRGFDADILLLDEKLNLRTVLSRGQVMMRGGEVEVKGTFEN